MIKDIKTRLVTLLEDDETANTESPIVPRSDFEQHSIHIDNPGGETVKIHGSNSPANTEADMKFVQIADDVTGSEIIILDGAIRWLKVVRGPGVTPVSAYVLSTTLGLG